MSDFDSQMAFNAAQQARNEAARVRYDLENLRAQQEKDEFKRWQNDNPVDTDWIESNFKKLFKAMNELHQNANGQKVDIDGLRKDLSRLEESVVQISSNQARQERQILFIEYREQIALWQRIIATSKDAKLLEDVATGFHNIMEMFSRVPNSKIFEEYSLVVKKYENTISREFIQEAFQLFDNLFPIFKVEFEQMLELNAAKENPVAVMNARRHDESLMKPYIDRVADEPWREALKPWLIENLQKDLLTVQLFPFFKDVKKYDDQFTPVYGEAIAKVKALSRRNEGFYLINISPDIYDFLLDFWKKSENPSLSAIAQKSRESYSLDEFEAASESSSDQFEFFGYIIDVMIDNQEPINITNIHQNISYFSYLRQFLKNKQIDPDEVPRLVDNLCINRNFYKNLRLIELGLDSKDPDSANALVYCKNAYRAFLTRLGDICADSGISFATSKTFDTVENPDPLINTYRLLYDSFKEGLSGSPLERALNETPVMNTGHMDNQSWKDMFNQRCITARPLIELASLPATPDELILMLRHALSQDMQNNAYFDLVPFALRLNALTTGLFTPWKDATGEEHASTWKQMTDTEKPTIEQMLALQVDLVNGKLFWTDGMEVDEETTDWHDKGRTAMDKFNTENRDSTIGSSHMVNEYRSGTDFVTRRERVLSSTFTQ